MSDKEKRLILKVRVSQKIPDNGVGYFMRELIFSNCILPETKALKELLLKHFPELKLDQELMQV